MDAYFVTGDYETDDTGVAMTLQEQSKLPTEASKYVLLQIENSLDGEMLESSTLFRADSA